MRTPETARIVNMNKARKISLMKLSGYLLSNYVTLEVSKKRLTKAGPRKR